MEVCGRLVVAWNCLGYLGCGSAGKLRPTKQIANTSLLAPEINLVNPLE
jgi:hypothetical protein